MDAPMPIANPASTISRAGVGRRLDTRGRDSFTKTSWLVKESRRAPSRISIRSVNLEEEEDIRGDISGDMGLGRIL
jgi:hypothetical protein